MYNYKYIIKIYYNVHNKFNVCSFQGTYSLDFKWWVMNKGNCKCQCGWKTVLHKRPQLILTMNLKLVIQKNIMKVEFDLLKRITECGEMIFDV